MAQIKKAIALGMKFIINVPDFVYQIKTDSAGELELWINDKPMSAVVTLTLKNLHISVYYAGIWLSKEIRLKDIVFLS